MRPLSLAPFLLLPLLAAAPDAGASAAPQEPAPVQPALELAGTLVPAEWEAVEFWPATWAGELLFLEVAEHGARVEAGQVVARFDTRGIDEQLRGAEEDLDAARLSLELDRRRAELEARAVRERLALAEADLERARQAMAAYREFDMPMRERQMEQTELRARDGLQDQKDELDQLRAMYEDDEITDATEDIVLKRSERQLERSIAAARLSAAQRKHQREFDWRHESQRREEELRSKTAAVEKQRVEAELDQRARRDRLARAERELGRKEQRLAELRQDRESFVLRAPRAGMLLHGRVEDYHPGASAPRHARGGRGSLRAPLFTVARPEGFHVAVRIDETDLSGLPTTAEVAVVPTIMTDGGVGGAPQIRGRLEFELFPLPESARAATNQYAGVVHVDQRMTGWAPGMRAKVVLQR